MKSRLVNSDRQTIDTDFVKPEQDNLTKPKGLWYGEDDLWLRDLVNPRLRLHEKLKPNTFEITVDESRICKLHSLENLSAFTARYSIKGDPKNDEIDWRKVADDWAGLEISEKALIEEAEDKARAYSRQAGKPTSMPMGWIYGWDVGSGCIWDSSALISSKKLRKVDPRLTALATLASQSTAR